MFEKVRLRTPFFETGVKNYIYGDAVLDYARIMDEAAARYDIDVLFIAPYTEIRRVAENTKHLIVLAPYMDTLYPGRGIADVLPEAILAAGARGVVINHCERPMTLPQIVRTIARANELGLLTFACADSIAETRALAQLRPDIINPEPTELIGSGQSSDMRYVTETLQIIRSISRDILVEQAAGIISGQQCYDFIMAGNDAVGASSGILKSADPARLADEMVASVKRAARDLARIARGAERS